MFFSLFLTPSVLFAEPIIKSIEWRELSDRDISQDGRAALQIYREAWQHAETEHFIYHFRDEKEAQTIYVHAEAYYEWVKQMFGVTQDTWTKKCHIFVFEDRKLWEEFNRSPQGERLPGAEAYTNGTELFIYRDPFFLAPQQVLAHEVTHIVVHRFVQGNIPLFLNEGISEFMASKAIALQAGGDEYSVRNFSQIQERDFIPLAKLFELKDYPKEKEAYYQESELFVRYLFLNYEKSKFYELLQRSAKGTPLVGSLKSIYDIELDDFEIKFRTYAVVKSTE